MFGLVVLGLAEATRLQQDNPREPRQVAPEFGLVNAGGGEEHILQRPQEKASGCDNPSGKVGKCEMASCKCTSISGTPEEAVQDPTLDESKTPASTDRGPSLSPTQIKDLLVELGAPGETRDASRRITLKERFLRENPGDPDCSSILNDLVREYDDVLVARALVAKYANICNNIRPFELERITAGIYERSEDWPAYRQCQELMLQSAKTLSERAGSQVAIGVSYFKEGSYFEARAALLTVVDSYAGSRDRNAQAAVADARQFLAMANKALNGTR